MRAAMRTPSPQVFTPKALPGAVGLPGEVEATTPPAYSPTTRAQRLGLLLNAAQPDAVALGPSSLDAQAASREGVLPAARVQVKDPASPTGTRDQYVTSVADPNQGLSINQTRAMKQAGATPINDVQGYKVNNLINQIRDLMERQDGVGAAEADARMAEYAKNPWENEKTSVTVPEKITVGQKANAVAVPGSGIPADAQIPQEAAQYVPQVVNNSSDLLGLLQKSLAAAAARRK